jgi:hypothetical protein
MDHFVYEIKSNATPRSTQLYMNVIIEFRRLPINQAILATGFRAYPFFGRAGCAKCQVRGPLHSDCRS